MPIPRTLEPELMDDPAEALLYDQMDHSEVNERFANDFLGAFDAIDGSDCPRRVIDLGCGTALIPIVICGKSDDCRVMAIDAAGHMLDLAARNIDIAGLRDRIELIQADAKSLGNFDAAMCDAVISNTLLHHLPEPIALLRSAMHLTRPGGLIFIRDLMRPESASEVDRLTELYTGNEPAEAQQLFHQSLHAALTLDEIRELASSLGLDPNGIQATTDRHWTMSVVRG